MFRLSMMVFFVTQTAIVNTALSKDQNTYRVLGAGNFSCGKWIEERRTSLFYNNVQWIEGFISARSSTSLSVSNALKKTDADGLVAWIDSYCRDHPLATIGVAATALSDELQNSN